MRKIKKIFMKVLFFLIKLVSYINTPIYMKLVVKYYQKVGINLNGNPKFIANDVYFDGSNYSIITLESDVVISREVMFLTHDYSISRGLQSIDCLDGKEKYFLKPITVGRNSFIGARTTILGGTTVGNNVIIGAGSVVKGIIPDNSIVIGNPCKVVGNTQDWARNKMNKKDYLTE